MKEDKISIIFHDLFGDISEVRDVLHLFLMEKTEKLSGETKHYLKEGLKKRDALVLKIEKLRKEIRKG